MDKEIIDGVDVSECDFRLVRDGNQKCECCHATGFGVICDCEMWKTCYYKQLKRLQAENERLKAENEQLNKMTGIFSARLCEKYRTTLQEIRDMADFKCALPSTELCHCKACDYADNIIAKINEVIGAE